MSIIMRIMQQFNTADEEAFMDLEKKFDELEKSRPGFPKGKRLQPIAASLPVNTLIWENTFPDIAAAYAALDFFRGDPEHEKLFAAQAGFIRSVKIEFYKILDF